MVYALIAIWNICVCPSLCVRVHHHTLRSHKRSLRGVTSARHHQVESPQLRYKLEFSACTVMYYGQSLPVLWCTMVSLCLYCDVLWPVSACTVMYYGQSLPVLWCTMASLCLYCDVLWPVSACTVMCYGQSLPVLWCTMASLCLYLWCAMASLRQSGFGWSWTFWIGHMTLHDLLHDHQATRSTSYYWPDHQATPSTSYYWPVRSGMCRLASCLTVFLFDFWSWTSSIGLYGNVF